jgi:glycogen debranching enzyme
LDEVYGSLVSEQLVFDKNDRIITVSEHHILSHLVDDSICFECDPNHGLGIPLYLQMEVPADCERIGELDDARMWKQKSEVLLKLMIEKSWDPKAGIFNATHQGKKLDVLTPFNLFPLITGRMPARISSKLIQHLQNRDEFWTAYPIPTVAANQSQYDPRVWRGPNLGTKYVLIEGLFKSGYADLARALRRRTLELLMARSDFYEYYHPETGDNPPNAAPIFGWSAALFIDMAIQATREANSGNGKSP